VLNEDHESGVHRDGVKQDAVSEWLPSQIDRTPLVHFVVVALFQRTFVSFARLQE
jgi:hypothetical protein